MVMSSHTRAAAVETCQETKGQPNSLVTRLWPGWTGNTQTHTQGQIDRQTGNRHTDRRTHTCRGTDRQTHRGTERHAEGQRHTEWQTDDKQAGGQTDRHLEGQTNTQTQRGTDRHLERQTDTQTEKDTENSRVYLGLHKCYDVTVADAYQMLDGPLVHAHPLSIGPELNNDMLH